MGGRSTHTKNVGERIAGMAIQTSLLGQPIPIGWGRGRLSCNLIDYLAFTAIPHTTTTTTSSSGGKGGGAGTTTKDTTYTYSASIILAICDGAISGINGVWKDAANFSGSGALASAGLSVALGSSSQTPWPYLTSLFPDHALAYRQLAYAYAQDYDLGSNGVVANHSFEVDFGIQFNPAGGVYDALPADILSDFFTNADHGIPSWPAGILADWSDWSLYCKAANLLLSPVLDSTTSGADFLTRVLQETNSDCFFSEGLLKIRALGDEATSFGGFAWAPDLTPVYALSEDDFDGEVQLEIQDQSQASNYVQVEYLDRSNQYQTAVATAYDLADILTYGRRQQDSAQQFHDICDPQTARNVAQLWLQRNLFLRDLYHFDLPLDFCLLEPMDYVSLTTTVDGMRLDGQLVRISQIDEDEEGKELLHFVAEGIPGHTASHGIYPDHSPVGVGVDVNADPGSIAAPLIFNAPLALTANGYELWAAVAGVNAAWGGAVVWASFDGTNYTPIGSINGPARYGVLSAALASHADPDSANTLGVDLTISKGQLSSVTTAEADAGATLCWVDGELVNFGTATLTAASKYNLTYLRRGQQGSAIGAHALGSNFARLDSAIFRYPYLAQHAGQTVYLKFQSYNVYGRALQDISACTAYSIALNPSSSIPSGLALAGGGSTWTGNSLNVVCNPVAGALSYRFDFYAADGTTLLRQITNASPNASYSADMAAHDGGQRSYKIACAAISPAGSSPASAQIAVSNTAPPAVSSPAATGGATDASITCTASADADLGGYVVFYSPTTGFDPRTSGSVVFSGINSVAITGLPAGTFFCRMAAFDLWSTDPALLNLSSEMSFTITTGGGASPTGSGGGGGGASGGGGGGFIGTKTYSN